MREQGVLGKTLEMISEGGVSVEYLLRVLRKFDRRDETLCAVRQLHGEDSLEQRQDVREVRQSLAGDIPGCILLRLHGTSPRVSQRLQLPYLRIV